ncbi:Choline-sulfatase [Tsuneonella dongtanensis]|uniref:Choline-sulfatase n=1 Tax=Tsuneonella dongtanensis TaxID=692370 RepID=A0A1B2AAY4_9SPHN|nr:sulfatase [Tsuneonella dongtanensis]ANY19333.1 Choline-sulfatase [Tsuneonella dongtanensis]
MRAALTGTFALALCGCAAASAPPSSIPVAPAPKVVAGAPDGGWRGYNVLLIALDDLNTDITAYGGNALTPNIDRLAASGTRFDQAYSVVPACNPSRTALLTGQRPETNGQYLNEGDFREKPGGESRITLPQFLRGKGYEAVAAGKIFHKPRGRSGEADPVSDPQSWDNQGKVATGTGGMEDYLDKDGWAKWLDGAGEYEGVPISEYIRKFGIWGPISQKAEETGDFQTARYCADYLSQRHDQPFFLACGLSRPHSPQLAPQEFFDLYPEAQVPYPDTRADDMVDVPKFAQKNWSTSFTRKLRSQPDEWRRAIRGYYASTSFADAAVGKILDSLERSGRAKDTIVVLLGDHGFQVGQKDRWEKFTLWDLGGHTTLVMRLPGESGVVGKPVSFLDLYPTLVSALGFERPGFVEGNDMMSLLRAPASAWDQPVVTTYQQGNNGVRWRNWNYIRYRDGSEELYDLSADPHEYTNLLAKDGARYDALRASLRAHIPAVTNPQQGYKPLG